MTTKTVYQTNADGIYVGQTIADESPREPGVWLVPAGCVEIEPPVAGPREVPVFAGSWSLVPDWRGVILFSTADGSPLQTAEVGKTPTDLSATEAPRPSDDCVWSGSEWVVDDDLRLTRLRQRALEKRSELLSAATEMTTGLADAFVAGMLSADEEVWFKAMAAYKRDLARIELDQGFPESPAWPALPPRPY